MNTNYSKIALLLALGAAAGEVGADSVEFYPKNVLNLKFKADSVSNELSHNANKISEVNKTTGDVVKAMNLVGKERDAYSFRGLSLENVGQKEVTSAVTEAYEVRESQLKALGCTKKLLKDVTKDLQSLSTDSPLEAFFPGKDKKLQLKLLEELGSGTSKDIDDSVIRDVSGLKFDSKYRCITPDEFFDSGVAAARDGLIKALSAVPGVVTVDKINYNMGNIKEVIKNVANIAVSRLAIDITKLPQINNANYTKIMNITRKVGAFDDFFSKLVRASKAGEDLKGKFNGQLTDKLAGIAGIAGVVEKSGMNLDLWIKGATKSFALAQTAIEKIQKEIVKGAKGQEDPEKNKNLLEIKIKLDFLKAVLAQEKAVLAQEAEVAADKKVKEKVAAMLSGESRQDAKLEKAASDDESEVEGNDISKEVDKIFDGMEEGDVIALYGEMGNALKKATSSSNKIGKIKSVNDFLKAKSSSSYVEFDKSLDDADHNNIRDHFNSVQIYIDNNKESPSFSENARKTKEELVKIMARVEADYARDMQNLVGNSAKSTSKMFKDLDREAINSVYAELKTSYAKVMQSLGDNSAPVVLAKKAAEAKTFADLEASDEFKAKTLKVTDISEDLKKIFAAEKDAGKANDMYAKIHTSLAVDPITKAQAEADVKALKELFAPEVRESLKLPANNPENALNLPAEKKEEAEPKGKKNARARSKSKGKKARGRGRSGEKAKGRNARGRGKGRGRSKSASSSASASSADAKSVKNVKGRKARAAARARAELKANEATAAA